MACTGGGQRAVIPEQNVTASGGRAPFEVYSDTLQLREGAQAIVNAFAAEVARARGTALFETPAVEVRNTPQLIFFSRNANRIVVPWWGTLPPEMGPVFRTFAAGGDAEAEHLFRAVFNRFLVAHEAAHWFQAHAGQQRPTLYENENAANRIAVAFWRTQPGGERFLAEMERLTAGAAAALTDPTPAGEDAVAYFGANYQALGADPLKYGYYQFRFMRDAVRDRGGLNFAEMVK
jgi:hypothetical protein